MNIDVEVVESDVDYEGMLVMLVVWRLGLAENVPEALTLMKNGAVLMDGVAVRDLNTRLPKSALLVVGLHGIKLGGGK